MTKASLHKECCRFADDWIGRIRQSMADTQASANEETKSSAGDKYETGRAMAQLEMEKGTAQLLEANRMRQALDQINPAAETETIQWGSIVTTDRGRYYISIAAGKITAGGADYYAVSPASPIALCMWGLREGQSFEFNKQRQEIMQVS